MPAESAPLTLHPARLLPADPGVRGIAERLYAAVKDLPIISPHGHVDPQLLLDDQPFTDPTSLLLQPDHYVTRLLHANGVSLADLGVGEGPMPEQRARKAWRLLCENWRVFRGTPVRYWFDSELGDIFGVTQRPSADNADELYDQISAKLAEESFRPRALLSRFGIDVLATTDDPADDLVAHDAIAKDPSFPTRVIPTFRPDRYLEAGGTGWIDAVKGLGAAAQVDVGEYAGYIEALEERRRFFISRGATSADHSHLDAAAEPLETAEAQRIYYSAMSGRVTPEEATAFRRHMVLEMARMSCDDGLVMTLHPGVQRNHHPATFARYGADTGHDIPVAVEYTKCAATAAGAVRHPSEPAPGAVHPGLRCLQPGDRATGRVLPGRVRRCPVVVPGQSVGDSFLPTFGHRDRRTDKAFRVHRRHPRVLLHSGPA